MFHDLICVEMFLTVGLSVRVIGKNQLKSATPSTWLISIGEAKTRLVDGAHSVTR